MATNRSNSTITTTSYKTTILKEGEGVYQIINKTDLSNTTLQFTFEKAIAIQPDASVSIMIISDVFDSTALKLLNLKVDLLLALPKLKQNLLGLNLKDKM